MQDAQAQKQVYSNWEAIWQKANTAGAGALTEQERSFFDTFNRLHPTDDSKRQLFDSLCATLDREIADNQKIFDQASILDTPVSYCRKGI